MNCNKHPDNEAAGSCTYCGKFFCKECLVELKGKMYCKDDLSKVFDEAKEEGKSSSNPMVFMNAGGGGGGGAAAASSSASSTSDNNNTTKMVPLKNKTTAAILAFFLGGLGVHKFYLGKAGQGIFYLLFCWTGVPAVIALIEAIILLSMNESVFISKFGGVPA